MDIYETIRRILPSLERVDEQENPQAIAHFTNQQGWEWYIIAGKELDNQDFYCFGYVRGFYSELGYFTLKQILEIGAKYDTEFIPKGIYTLFPELLGEF